MEEDIVTLINVYVPPGSNRQFFKSLFDAVALEAEGICICGGDFNVVLNQHLDTTSQKKIKNNLSKLISTACGDNRFFDVWRYAHPLDRNYTRYSFPHNTYSRLDYFLMPKSDCYRVKECRIGVSDISDHSALYLTVHLDKRRRNTAWRLNIGKLNNKKIVELIKLEIKEYLEVNDNGTVDPSILWDSLKAVICGKLIALAASNKKT